MADAVQQEWPDQRLKILVPTWTLMGISTIFVVWRFIYGFMQGRKFMVCDYLLILATATNIAAHALSYITVENGLGRHIMDPSVMGPEVGMTVILRYSYFLWIAQIVNIIGVALLKWSICAYLLVLNFSKVYQGIVWLSILMVTAFNFLAPVLTLFGCTPLEANWNRGVTGKCWARGTLELSYTQGISNILTDVVYMAAPLIYLSRVQLSKRTQWGLRVVFLLSIPATVCSIFKTIELRTIVKTQDPTWDGINLSIWSATELSVGILIASLPPLRKAFDRMFQRILPSTITGSHKTPGYGYGHSSNANNIRMNTFQNNRTHKSGHPGESILDNDDESERAILDDDDEGKGPGIIKTTKVTVSEEGETSSQRDRESPGSYKPNNDWAISNSLEKGTHHAI
ncbi:hypothetical protein BS50DRAFT_630650 [Corynespora cassiicola Philippines]|uniref:Rhodopsin domain-containing protein n=1 Tax=Corynespora cassiicola Philippines TaxID=1448308 RepID=A0A2T2P4X9_CORCC|nr:hypothetical protein BS50DRAFT_630650 [Corynespora cassiicola Philippines]